MTNRHSSVADVYTRQKNLRRRGVAIKLDSQETAMMSNLDE